jgi:hypothetical protein
MALKGGHARSTQKRISCSILDAERPIADFWSVRSITLAVKVASISVNQSWTIFDRLQPQKPLTPLTRDERCESITPNGERTT